MAGLSPSPTIAPAALPVWVLPRRLPVPLVAISRFDSYRERLHTLNTFQTLLLEETSLMSKVRVGVVKLRGRS